MDNAAPLTAVVVDNGSKNFKIGFGGESAPREEWENAVGSCRHPGVSGVMLQQGTDSFVGSEVASHRGLLNVQRPVARGYIGDWNAAKHVWHRIFFGNGSLNVACEEHPLLITGSPDESRESRERKAQVLFETFNIPALVLANTATLSVYATGRTSGVVVDSGAGRTHIGPVWEGYVQPHFLRRMDLAGDDLTAHLFGKLRHDGYPLSTPADREVAERVKESLCYVADDMSKESQYCRESKSIERLFSLPDGQQIFMNEHRFTIPEVLFQPSLLGFHGKGIHDVVQETISLCDPLIQPELYSSIVLAGGNTLFPRLEDRLQREVALQAPKGTAVKVVSFPERKYAAWLGGSIMGSLSTFPCMWVSKNEYDDYGASMVHRKCN